MKPLPANQVRGDVPASPAGDEWDRQDTRSYPGGGERLKAAGSRPSHKGEMQHCSLQRFSFTDTSRSHQRPGPSRVAVMTPARSQRKCFPSTSARIQAMLYQSDEVQKKCLLQGTEGVKLFRKYTEMNRLKKGICSQERTLLHVNNYFRQITIKCTSHRLCWVGAGQPQGIPTGTWGGC